MKKILFVLIVAFASVQFTNAQENRFAAEIQAGLPTGDFGDFYDFGVSVNASYYFVEVAESLYIGGRGGYSTFIPSEDVLDNFDFFCLKFFMFLKAGIFFPLDAIHAFLLNNCLVVLLLNRILGFCFLFSKFCTVGK